MSTSGSRHLKPIIHSRNSSTDSRTSSQSSSSGEYRYYETSTSRSTMANGGYREDREKRTEKRRVPDNKSHVMTTMTSRSGKNKVHAHGARYYDPEEPRASEARYEDYQRTKDYNRSSQPSYSSGSSTR
ncbi:uncharacterized protein LY89DRAFT_726801 [Mollisia scopiformis]|uniref:Uncharacterized protein n=1 Tax=Mollisia scopiformis TaxID=149040 RepID=A0A194XUM6_MOLSC|nr:uncharacterized protein LY89DRAFT_726801 [Mollisia scopiformis]KUJ23739.1 hypothetical protein LY89DRAFT_726801 [Mollisia scopiformis]